MMGWGNCEIVSAAPVDPAVAKDDCNGGNVVKGSGEGGRVGGGAFSERSCSMGLYPDHTVCFPHPYWIYEKSLSTFICCG
jgi:hypothetical protein